MQSNQMQWIAINQRLPIEDFWATRPRLLYRRVIAWLNNCINAPPFRTRTNGYTDNGIDKRLSQLQTASPYKLDLLATIEGDLETELYLHNRFKDIRTSGEWFNPSIELLEFIDATKVIAHDLDTKAKIKERIAFIKKRIGERIITNENPVHYMI